MGVLRILVFSGLTCLAFSLGAQTAAPAKPSAVAGEDGAWKPFQEFNFLLGSWSGTAASGGRVGGRVVRFTLEMGGNFLVHKGNTIFAAQAGAPEETIEEVGYYFYDRERRKYVAHYYYSTGLTGTYDVEFPSPASIRVLSTQLTNYEAGARTRFLMSKSSETEASFDIDIALPGKDFVPFLTSKLNKK